MKLITHNILMCNKKGCTKNNFPLKLAVKSFSDFDPENAQEYSPVLMNRLLEKIEWSALRSTVASIPEWGIQLPEEVTPELRESEKFL